MLLQEFKIKASRYQKEHNCKRNEALHAIAKELGFKNYNAYLGSLKNNKKTIEPEVVSSYKTMPNWVCFGPIRDAKTGQQLNPDDIGTILNRTQLEQLKQNNLEQQNKAKCSDLNQPLGTGKYTMHEALMHQFDKEINRPGSDLLKGYFVEENSPKITIEDAMEIISYQHTNIKEDTTIIYKTIDSLKNNFGYQQKVKPIKVKKSSLPKIPKEFVGNDKDYYNRLLINLRQELMNNMTLKNCVNFITQYNAVFHYLMKTYPTMFMCGCLGPKNGEPLCPCRMRNVFKLEDGWFHIDHDEKKRIRIKPCVKNSLNNMVFYIAESNGQYVLTD